MRLQGKIAFITGFGSGIGRATAVLFAREGARISGVSLENSDGEATCENIRASGGQAIFRVADVRNSSQIRAAIDATIREFGGLDIVVNSAGIATRGSIAQVAEQEWDTTIDTNLKGIYLVSRIALPKLIERGGGVIINIGAVVGLLGKGGRAVQSASKGGVITLTEAMAADHAHQNIRVNCICPGPTEIPMHERLAQTYSAELKAKQPARFRLGRMGRADDSARMAVFLASDDAQYATGAIIPVDGGVRLPSD